MDKILEFQLEQENKGFSNFIFIINKNKIDENFIKRCLKDFFKSKTKGIKVLTENLDLPYRIEKGGISYLSVNHTLSDFYEINVIKEGEDINISAFHVINQLYPEVIG